MYSATIIAICAAFDMPLPPPLDHFGAGELLDAENFIEDHGPDGQVAIDMLLSEGLAAEVSPGVLRLA